MQNAMMNLLLVIRNGLGLKSLGYCFQFLEFHTYNNNKIVFITVLYIGQVEKPDTNLDVNSDTDCNISFCHADTFW